MFAEKIIQEWLTEIHYKSPVLIKKTYTSMKVDVFQAHGEILDI